MAEYINVKLEKNSEYDNLSLWKNKYDKPANLMLQSMKFEISEDIKPGTYQVNVWKAKERKSDNSPHGSVSLVRIEDNEAGSGGEANEKVKDDDFNF